MYKVLFKRMFDFIAALLGLLFFSWLIFITWVIASIETRSNGFFVQQRIGRHGKLFGVIKIKTMFNVPDGVRSSISVSGMKGITFSGKLFRRFKIDELPQLWNVLIGEMSFVGPRPDVAGYADLLTGENRLILELRPGITGPASIKYKNEESILAKENNPIKYNDEIIWPDKVKLNLNYYYNHSFNTDITYIYNTIIG